MNQSTWIAEFCEQRKEWKQKKKKILSNEGLPYLDLPQLILGVVDDVNESKCSEEILAIFSCIEKGIVEGDDETKNLIIVGLFEALQNRAYADLNEPDALDQYLGPKSQEAWADLIESWTGKNIRTIEHWRRVLVNGPYDWVKWKDGNQEIHWQRKSSNTTDPWISKNHQMIAKAFQPLVAEKLETNLTDLVDSDQVRTVEIARGSGPGYQTIIVGPRNALGTCRIVQVESKIAWISDQDAKIVWPEKIF